MGVKDLLDGFLNGRQRVVLLPFEDQPEQTGTLLGPDLLFKDDGLPTDEDKRRIIEADVWVVCVDEDQRPADDTDGLRGSVTSDQIRWA